MDEKRQSEREAKEERLRTLLVEMLMAFRREYLQTTGCNRLEHWRIVLDRMQAASRASRNADEWVTQVAKSLQIQQLGKYACSTLIELSSFAREQNMWPDARRIVDKERGLLEAIGRRIAEERKEAREAAAEEEATT